MRFAWSWVLLIGGCALGADGVHPRTGDASGFDAGTPVLRCEPPCAAGELCRDGRCVEEATDADDDGVPAALDCDDTDPEVGREAQRLCASACGEGLTDCVDGEWTACSAPTECHCEVGETRQMGCGRCGTQRQVCAGGAWADDGGCEGEGVCMPGAIESRTVSCGACGEGTQVETRTCSASCAFGGWTSGSCMTSATCAPGATDSETRACTGACGGTQTRSRTCSSSTCTWGSFGAWSTCPSSCCGDGVCGSGETCSSCADCRYGHLGTGDHGDSCAGVPAETWRCVYAARLGGYVSQVCRSGGWINFNFDPRNCSACICSFSLSCCQVGSTSTACN